MFKFNLISRYNPLSGWLSIKKAIYVDIRWLFRQELQNLTKKKRLLLRITNEQRLQIKAGRLSERTFYSRHLKVLFGNAFWAQTACNYLEITVETSSLFKIWNENPWKTWWWVNSRKKREPAGRTCWLSTPKRIYYNEQRSTAQNCFLFMFR